MPSPFLLDTNAYYRFFQHRRTSTETEAYERLRQKITEEPITSFYISEITSMEIHSVLGQYRRGIREQRQQCTRKIMTDEGVTRCEHRWITYGRGRMSQALFHDIRKMIADIEAQRGDVQAEILELDTISIQEAKRLLMKYADQHYVGSHDALIAGSLLAKKQEGLNLTLVTSDRIFKHVLEKLGIDVYDPFIS